jgi:mono/diheme cytochrome c family protein
MATAVLVSAACQSPSPGPQAQVASESTAPPTDAPSGSQLYARNCASCHGLAGAGGLAGVGSPAPAFVDRDQGQRLDLATITHAVRTGPGAMPPNTALSNEELAALAAHIRRLIDAATPPAPTPDP